jgi:hypothetical protein
MQAAAELSVLNNAPPTLAAKTLKVSQTFKVLNR